MTQDNAHAPENNGTRVHFIEFSNGNKACYVDGKLHSVLYETREVLWTLEALRIEYKIHLALPQKSPLPENFSDLTLIPWQRGSCGFGAFGG